VKYSEVSLLYASGD